MQTLRENAPWLKAYSGEQETAYRPGAARKTGRVPHVTAETEWGYLYPNQGGTVFYAPLTFGQGCFIF